MKTIPPCASLHHRRQYQESARVYRDDRQYQDGQRDTGDRQDPAQRVGVLSHNRWLPGPGLSLTDARCVHE